MDTTPQPQQQLELASRIRHDSRHAHLLALPTEIRLKIFRCLLVLQHPINLTFLASKAPRTSVRTSIGETAALLRVSQQIGNEAADMFYGENIFQIEMFLRLSVDTQSCVSFLPSSGRQRIRRLQLCFLNIGQESAGPLHLEPTLWTPILSSLIKLSIVACDAVLPADISHGSFDAWRAWVMPSLRYLNASIPHDLIVDVDDDHKPRLRSLLEICFADRTRSIRTEVGNVIFARS